MNSRVGKSKQGFVKVGSIVKYDNLYFIIKEIFNDGETFKVKAHQTLNKQNIIEALPKYMLTFIETIEWKGYARCCEIIETKRKIG